MVNRLSSCYLATSTAFYFLFKYSTPCSNNAMLTKCYSYLKHHLCFHDSRDMSVNFETPVCTCCGRDVDNREAHTSCNMCKATWSQTVRTRNPVRIASEKTQIIVPSGVPH